MSFTFQKYNLGNVELNNRLVLSPMCMYNAEDGFINDFHQTHYVTRAIGGVGLVMLEATAVSPEARISKGDLGLWKKEHTKELEQLANNIHATQSKLGIQLAHAGRKAATQNGKQLKPEEGFWQCFAPSAIPFLETDTPPKEMNLEEIEKCITDFRNSAQMAVHSGVDVIEIHAAHGYLIHQFLSPITNHRTDIYGGNQENRFRFLLRIVDEVSEVLTDKNALIIRISATDYLPNAWDIEDSIALAKILKKRGVALIDVSSGGNYHQVDIPIKALYQVPFAQEIKNQAEIATGAVGLITKIEEIESILENKQADLVFLGRELLRNPYFPMQCAFQLNETIPLPSISYLRAKSK